MSTAAAPPSEAVARLLAAWRGEIEAQTVTAAGVIVGGATYVLRLFLKVSG